MANLTHNLLVPINVEALCVGQPDSQREFVSSSTDFSQLPYRVGEDYINDGPNISEYLMAQPFEGDGPLEPGIHLHWRLPKALTHGVNPTKDQTGQIDFPALPNRWLIRRTVAGNATQTRSWLIESDYLSKTNLGHNPTVPVTPKADDPQPYRYLGRVYDFDTWQEGAQRVPDPGGVAGTSAGTSKAEYWPKLTAIGPGVVDFAAFYPNCPSVFGFYDPADDVTGQVSYRVVGWYHDPHRDDPLSQIGPGKAFKTLSDFKKAYRWQFGEEDDQQVSARTLCTGAMTDIDWHPNDSYAQTEDGEIQVAIGNTPAEALSAIITVGLTKQPHAERLLNALQVGWLPELDQYGGLQSLEYYLQQNSFGAIQGGHLWLIKEQTGNTAAPSNTEQTLPRPLATALNELNVLQQQYDHAQDEIEAQRWQIFADWYKYMVAEYAPDKDCMVEVDRMVEFIEAEIEALHKKVAQIGQIPVNQAGQLETAALPAPSTLASQVIAKAQQIQHQLQQLQTSTPQVKHILQTVAAPRYWQPNEPVILVAAHSRYTQPPQGYRQEDDLACQLIPSLLDTPDQAINKEASLVANDSLMNMAVHVWPDQNPWLPLFLQWEVQYQPVRKMSDRDGYLTDTVSACYDVVDDDLDLQYNNQHSPSGLETYRGTSVLTPHMMLNLKDQLDKYLAAHPKAQADSSPLTEAQQQDNDLFDQLQALSQELRILPALSQSLGGFNPALLMRKQTLHRPVGDPLAATPGLDAFSETVKTAVGRFNTDAPLPENYYNPIRGGFMALSQLRLVDAFGQIKAINTDNIIRAESLIISDDTSPQKNHIFLAPRLTQPARLCFRWLAADNNALEMNTHPATTPVCGWVLPNYLDSSLMIYDAQGHYIGYLGLVPGGSQETWHSAPGQVEVGIRTALAHQNPHLRDFVNYIYNDSVSRGFLQQFFQVTNLALDHIDPLNHEQHQGLAVLMGRPLALVRASLKLDLKGGPAYCQSWDSFAADVQRGQPDQRDTQGFTQVKFPVKLGDPLHINDGLVGYYLEDASGQPNYRRFYAPMAAGDVNDVVQPKPNTITLDTDPASPPVRLTMLVDPRAKVHATTAILPVKSIEIPPDQYLAALKTIEVTFMTSPVLSDVAHFAIPLPTEAAGQWSWISKQDPLTWAPAQTIGPVTDRATLAYKRQQISAGWLKLSHSSDE